MKKFKLIDTWGSIILIFAFTLLSLIKLDYTFLIGYCVVGGWQLVSIIVHVAQGWFTHKKGRRNYYHLVVAAIAALALVGLAAYPVLFIMMVLMLFAAPFMAAYYAWLCYVEVYVKMQRPLALLR